MFRDGTLGAGKLMKFHLAFGIVIDATPAIPAPTWSSGCLHWAKTRFPFGRLTEQWTELGTITDAYSISHVCIRFWGNFREAHPFLPSCWGILFGRTELLGPYQSAVEYVQQRPPPVPHRCGAGQAALRSLSSSFAHRQAQGAYTRYNHEGTPPFTGISTGSVCRYLAPCTTPASPWSSGWTRTPNNMWTYPEDLWPTATSSRRSTYTTARRMVADRSTLSRATVSPERYGLRLRWELLVASC